MRMRNEEGWRGRVWTCAVEGVKCGEAGLWKSVRNEEESGLRGDVML